MIGDSTLNGVRPDGSYAYSRPDDREVARWFVPAEPPPKSRLRAPGRGVDADDLGSAGWAVVYPPGERMRLEALLHDLLELRQDQAGDLYRSIELFPNEDCYSFLERHRANTGQADPERLPYYLLLAGSPKQIPFELQGQLDQIYAVGRIHFDEEERYAAYAKSVKDAETDGEWKPRRRMALFGVQNRGDRATLRTTERLIKPLGAQVGRRLSGRTDWLLEQVVERAATKARLAELLTAPEAPAVLFTASHGMVFDPEDARQTALQGALLCSDWGGPGTSVRREDYLAAEDLVIRGRPLHGSIIVHLACHSGGTPSWDSFHPPGSEDRRRLTRLPFVAALPQRLLGDAGALAVVAHVDRAWTTSFDWNPEVDEPDPKVFQDLVLPLLDGCRIGDATESLGSLYGLLATRVKECWDQDRSRGALDPAGNVRLWRATNDIRNFAVFGDPAVRVGGGPP
jgi:hypothetical protein